MMKDTQEGDTLILTFSQDRTDVNFNQEHVGTIEGEAFGKVLLATWLGSHPPSESLKTGLLGISED